MASDTVAGVSAGVAALAIVVTIVLWWRERAARQRDRREDTHDVLVVARLLQLGRGPSGEPHWWRITLTGGTQFSRATLTKFTWGVEHVTDALADIGGSVVLAAGQSVHVRGYAPTSSEYPYRVELAWTTGTGSDQRHQTRSMTVLTEPWS